MPYDEQTKHCMDFDGQMAFDFALCQCADLILNIKNEIWEFEAKTFK